ncbi:hypothetical protein GCM10010991_15350 [Gemmobacter aquaticus]|uniref:Uncharacterized protein n=1 Tax=Gemmobacter aquaticus TaxID=490185 RepID=A0A917YKQ2_9RHOB|nr:hypothetical protein GCM10010991_15350 [Gemmobacter aquaticus]
MHEKIGPHHLQRKAILYVGQSSAHNVLHSLNEYGPDLLRRRSMSAHYERALRGKLIVATPVSSVVGAAVAS